MPRKPTTSSPAIVRRRSADGLADGAGLAVGDSEGDAAGEAGIPSVAGATLGVGERWLDEGRQAATRAAPAARAAPRNLRRVSNRYGLGSGITPG